MSETISTLYHGATVDAPVSVAPAGLPLPRGMERQVANLCRALRIGEDGGPRVIQFVGVRPEDGASAACLGLAAYAALRLGVRTVLVEADPPGPDRGGVPGLGTLPVLDTTDPSLALAGLEINPGRLFLAPLWHAAWSALHGEVGPTMPMRMQKLLELRDVVDLIVIDSNQSALSPDCHIIGSLADGVVMVVDPVRTPMELATQVRNRVVGCGGHLLGLVLSQPA